MSPRCRTLLLALALLCFAHIAFSQVGNVAYFTADTSGHDCGSYCGSNSCTQLNPCVIPNSITSISHFDIAIYSGVYNPTKPLSITFPTPPPLTSSPPVLISLASNGGAMRPGSNSISGLVLILNTIRSVKLRGFLNSTAVVTRATNCRFEFNFLIPPVTSPTPRQDLNIEQISFHNPSSTTAITMTIDGKASYTGLFVNRCTFFSTPLVIAAEPAIHVKLQGAITTAFLPDLSISSSQFYRTAVVAEDFHYVGYVAFTQCVFTASVLRIMKPESLPAVKAFPYVFSFIYSQVVYPTTAPGPVAFTLPHPQILLFTFTEARFSLENAMLMAMNSIDSTMTMERSTLNASMMSLSGVSVTINRSEIMNSSQFTTNYPMVVTDSVISSSTFGSTSNLTMRNTTISRGSLTSGTLSIVRSYLFDIITVNYIPSTSEIGFSMVESYWRNPPVVIVRTPFYIANSIIDVVTGGPNCYFQLGSNAAISGNASGLTVYSPSVGDFRVGNVIFGVGSSLEVDTMQLTAERASFASIVVKSSISSLYASSSSSLMDVTPAYFDLSPELASASPVIWSFHTILFSKMNVNVTGATRFDYFHTSLNGIKASEESSKLIVEASLPIRIVWALPTAPPEMGPTYHLFNHPVSVTSPVANWNPIMARETSDAYVFNSTASTQLGIHFQLAPPPPSEITLPPNSGTVTIPGNVTTDAPIVFTGTGTTLVLDGCVINVTAGLLYTFDGKLPNGTYLALVQNADCPESLENIPLSVNAPKARECEENKAIRSSESSKTQLYVLFLFDDSKCTAGRKSWPIIVGSVLGGIVVLAVVTTIVSVHVWKSRHGAKAELAKMSNG